MSKQRKDIYFLNRVWYNKEKEKGRGNEKDNDQISSRYSYDTATDNTFF